MPLPRMTYALAMAAGTDAANRNMRSEGRLTWNEDDRDLAALTFNTLYPVESVALADIIILTAY
jgi:hypothetical protein